MYKSKKLKDNVVTIGKQPTWTDRILALNKGEWFPIEEKYGSTVRPLISKYIRTMHPELNFSVKKRVEDGVNYLIVTREL